MQIKCRITKLCSVYKKTLQTNFLTCTLRGVKGKHRYLLHNQYDIYNMKQNKAEFNTETNCLDGVLKMSLSNR